MSLGCILGNMMPQVILINLLFHYDSLYLFILTTNACMLTLTKQLTYIYKALSVRAWTELLETSFCFTDLWVVDILRWTLDPETTIG